MALDQGLDLSSSREERNGDQCCGRGLATVDVYNPGAIWRRPLRISAPQHVEGLNEEDLMRPQTPRSVPPAIDPAPATTSAIVAQELNKLSLQDRNRVLEEIHGVQDAPALLENDEFVGRSLLELTAELQSVPAKSAFAEARRRDSAYVSRRDFLLKFLRAEHFCVKNVATRILAFFEYKLELFGTDKLTKDIEIRDILDDPDDRMALASGLFQPLSTRDRSGRIVIGKFHKHKYSGLKLESRLRLFYYMLMTTTEYDVDQKRGIVLLVTNQEGVVDRMDAWRNTTLLVALPVRVNGFHVCHNDPKITVLGSLAMLAMGPVYRARFRLHEGSIVENIYTLLTFGLSSSSIPVHPVTGEVRLDALNEWIEKRKFIERGPSAASITTEPLVSEPNTCDVIFGRGKGTQNHPGNTRLREFIDANLEAYEGAKLLEKTLIAERVVQQVKSLSGRFLKQAGSGWAEVKDESAREKISHAFRDRRRKLKQREQEVGSPFFSHK